MVDVACRFMQYTQTEFCGKCVSCREGTKRMNELLWALRNYRLSEEDFSLLMDLGEMISVTAFCNLGRGSFSGRSLRAVRKRPPLSHPAGRSALQPHLSGRGPRHLPRVQQVRAQLPCECHHRRRPLAVFDRPGKVREMLYLHRGLPLRRDQGGGARCLRALCTWTTSAWNMTTNPTCSRSAARPALRSPTSASIPICPFTARAVCAWSRRRAPERSTRPAPCRRKTSCTSAPTRRGCSSTPSAAALR